MSVRTDFILIGEGKRELGKIPDSAERRRAKDKEAEWLLSREASLHTHVL